MRPEPILRLAVDLLKQKWKDGCPYNYARDQLKAIRQDLMVRGLHRRCRTVKRRSDCRVEWFAALNVVVAAVCTVLRA